MIRNVFEGSPAMESGLLGLSRGRSGNVLAGDLIVGIDENEITSNVDLIEILEKYKPGDLIYVTYKRGNKVLETKLKLTSSVE